MSERTASHVFCDTEVRGGGGKGGQARGDGGVGGRGLGRGRA